MGKTAGFSWSFKFFYYIKKGVELVDFLKSSRMPGLPFFPGLENAQMAKML